MSHIVDGDIERWVQKMALPESLSRTEAAKAAVSPRRCATTQCSTRNRSPERLSGHDAMSPAVDPVRRGQGARPRRHRCSWRDCGACQVVDRTEHRADHDEIRISVVPSLRITDRFDARNGLAKMERDAGDSCTVRSAPTRRRVPVAQDRVATDDVPRRARSDAQLPVR